MRASREVRQESGQATLLVIAVATLVVVSMVAVGRFGAVIATIEQAQVAADAAALAAVDGGVAAARRLAHDNGAELVAITRTGDDVVVTVNVHGHLARARARRAP